MDDKPQVIRVIEAAQRLSDDEIRRVLEILREEYRHRLRRADRLAAMALGEGDWVETVQPARKLPAAAQGHITGIRRECVDVHFPKHGMFTVSAALLRKIDPPRAAEPPTTCPAAAASISAASTPRSDPPGASTPASTRPSGTPTAPRR